MTADPSSFDAYRTPVLPDVPYSPAAGSGRPGMLTTLCVLCIVLGVLGILNSLFGAGGIVLGKAIQSAMPKAGTGMPPDLAEAQEEYQNAMYAIQDKYLWALIPSLVFRFGVALLLLIGGIKALSLDEKGRRLVVIACAIAIAFELLVAILQSFIMLENLTATNSYFEKLSNSMQGQGNIAKVTGQIVSVLAVVVTTILTLLKIALYLFGLIYLRRDNIRGLFRSTASPSAAAQIS